MKVSFVNYDDLGYDSISKKPTRFQLAPQQGQILSEIDDISDNLNKEVR